MARNKFKAALNHIKSTDVDEKIQRLNEAPTNSMSGVYDLSPQGQRYGAKNPPKTFYSNLDGSWPDGVPGTPGERTYVRPRGYWEEGPGAVPSVQHDQIVELDFSYDTQTDDPRNTKTIIDETTGRVKTDLPPNSRSFILGPLVDMFHFNHGYDNRTFVGYIQKDTREFVLLASIRGTWGNDNNGVPIRADGYEGGTTVWDGTDSSFVSYNPSFTFEMLQWHHERLKEGKYVKNVSFFHSGGVPVVQGAGGTGQPAGTNQGNVSGTPGPGNAGNNGNANQTHGSGGNPNVGNQQNPPVTGNEVQAGFPWNTINNFVERGQNAFQALMNMTPGQKAELAMTALDIGLDIAAVAGILFPEPGTTAAGLARMATRLGIKAGSAAMKGARAARGAQGLARGLKGAQVGATGVKKVGYQALKGGQNLHKGSKGLLSPGGKGVYSAPKVGQVGPGGFRPGSGGARYVKSGSNPLGGAQGKGGQAGGVLGSITPGGARRIGGIEPQAVVNPRQFQKGQKLFQKIQSGAYPRSSRAGQFRQQAQKAGFKPGQANIPASQIPKSRSGRPTSKRSGLRREEVELLELFLTEVATPTPTVETPPVTQGARESAQQTADATADMIAQQYPKDQVAEYALDSESAAEYETTKDTNIQELLNKAPGTLTPYEEQILLDAGFDDYVRGGMKGTDLMGDLFTLGLSLAAAKAILPLLAKVGGNFVNLIAHEHGMRAITDAAYKTFQQTGQMPPWYHWAFWKLLPQSTLNAFARIAGTTPAKSILATEGTAAGKAALHTILKPAALIQFFSMLLGGDQRGAENLLSNEIRSIAEKAVETEQYDLLDALYDEIGADEFFKLYDVTENLLGFTERSDEISDILDKLYDDDYNEGWTVRPGNRQDLRIKLDSKYAEINRKYTANIDFMNSRGGFGYRQAEFTSANVPSWWKGSTPEEGQTYHVVQLYWKDTGLECSRSDYDLIRETYGKDGLSTQHNDAIDRANDRVDEYEQQFYDEMTEMFNQVYIQMIVDYMLMKPNTQLPSSFSYDPGKDYGDRADAYDNYNWLWKTYGIDAAEWYLENQKLPMESNPFIPAGAYLPLAKGDLTDLPQGAESTFGTRDSATIASLIGATAKRKEEEERKKRNVTASFKQSGQLISEDRKKLLREIKQPLNEVGELQPQKLKNYRPNFKGRYVPQNTPDVTASKEANDMVRAKNAAGQTWRYSDKYWGGYESQERANVIYDHVGHGQLYWDEIVANNQGKKTSRDREIQEELNKKYSLIAEKEMASIIEQETLDAPKDPLFKKVRNKLKDKIDYQDKPSKLGYPNTPPKEQEQGYHPDYGKRKDYYKKLDPHSADAMPETGDLDTDDTVEKQKSLYGLYLKKQRMQGKPNS